MNQKFHIVMLKLWSEVNVTDEQVLMELSWLGSDYQYLVIGSERAQLDY